VPLFVFHQDFFSPCNQISQSSKEFLTLSPPDEHLDELNWSWLTQLCANKETLTILATRHTVGKAMRSSIFVLAASGCLASATWSNGRDLGVGIPSPARETGASNARVDATGWTPRPTEPPGREAVMELLKRRRGLGRRQDTNTWINDRTCGWFSESSCKWIVVKLQASCRDFS